MAGEGFDLGSATGHVDISFTEFDKNIQEIKRGLSSAFEDLGGMISDFGDQLAGLGKSMTILTAPFTAFEVAGIKVAASFEDVMTQIKVFGNVTTDELEQVRQFVLKMGADTVFSAQDAGEAMLDLLKSGMTMKEAMATLPTVLQLATVGNLSLAQSADVVSGAMAQYGLEADQAGIISNALAKGANASKADVSDLGQALSNVGGIANLYGLSIEDTIAILSEFAQRNIKGAEAGTQLKSMLTHMNTTKPAREALQGLGVTTAYTTDQIIAMARAAGKDVPGAWVELSNVPTKEMGEVGERIEKIQAKLRDFHAKMDKGKQLTNLQTVEFRLLNEELKSLTGGVSDGSGAIKKFVIDASAAKRLGLPAVGEMRPINDVIKDLNKSMANMTEAQKIAAIKDIAGSYGQLGLEALLSANGIDSMNDAMGKAPSAADVAGASTGTLNRLIESLGGSVETFQTTIFQPFIDDYLKPGIQQVINFINSLTEWATKNPELAETIVVIATAVAALGPILFVVGTAISAIGTIIAGLPLALFVAGLAALGAAFVSNFGGIRDTVMNAWAAIQPVLQLLFNWFMTQGLPLIVAFIQTQVMPVVQGFFDYLGQVWAIVQPALVNLFNWFMAQLPSMITFVQTVVVPAIQGFFDLLANAWTVIGPALLSLLDWFLNTGLPGIVNFVNTTAIPIIGTLITNLQTFWDTISPSLLQFGRWFTDEGMPKISNIVKNFHDVILKPLVDLLTGLWSLVQPALDTFGKWWKDNMPGIQTIVDNFLTSIKNLITLVDDGLQRIADLGKAWDNLKNGMLNFAGNGGTGADIVDVVLKSLHLRDQGGPGIAGQPYMIGKGAQPEAFIPSQNGTFIPNIDKVLAGMTGGGGGSVDKSVHFGPNSVVINANSEAEGRAAADGFSARLMETLNWGGA